MVREGEGEGEGEGERERGMGGTERDCILLQSRKWMVNLQRVLPVEANTQPKLASY